MSRRNDSMCDGDLDAILSYLSSKINKIFCDREFVGCVKEDFDIILQNTNNHCVVFPKLKPIFLKVLRYQAVIFDLSVFCIGSGCNQVAVVCKKTFLKEQANECPREEGKQAQRTMDSEEQTSKTTSRRSNRVNRPTQSYYVPPAQRSSTKQKTNHEHTKTSKKVQAKSKSQTENSRRSLIEVEQQETDVPNIPKTNGKSKAQEESPSVTLDNSDVSICTDDKDVSQDSSSIIENNVAITTECNQLNAEESTCVIIDQRQSCLDEISRKNEDDQSSKESNEPSNYSSVSIEQTLEESNLAVENSSFCTNSLLADSQRISEEVQCVNSTNSLQSEVQISEKEDTCRTSDLNQNVQNNIFLKLVNDYFSLNDSCETKLEELNLRAAAEDVLEYKEMGLHAPTEENSKIQSSADQTSHNEKVEQIIKCLESVLAENNRAYEINGYTDKEAAKEILVQKLVEQINSLFLVTTFDSSCSNKDAEASTIINTKSSNESDDSVKTQSDEQKEDKNNSSSTTTPLYITYNNDSIDKKDVYIDNENEEIQRPTENNRKSRSVMKHNIRNVDSLKLVQNETVPQKHSAKNLEESFTKDEQDGLSTWEDMFDEKGDLQPEYVEEIVKRIGCGVKVVKASHDYSAYQNTKYQDLEHVIELYDFPSSFKTQDLIQLYRGASQDPMYVKWCDDTHALLVLSSPVQAQRALQIEHEIIKSRPLSQASAIAALTASSADLKPAMKRPQTNMQTARRLINTHLGTKSTLSKEIAEQERRALQDAREQRRQERQNEKDAWEGRPRCAKSLEFS
ncbi:hypothetical protein ILUMI_02694 [Ignelater luminosus]|uniref:Coiled-coil domain-containing protein R3HCC1L n=1 Tax=Ignelater luminosus TaxID=2038154 RepID=A0A8K0DD01_IGNLU|nr:hypothetical protein ILUMI_02694 [Ignelater luminosus]